VRIAIFIAHPDYAAFAIGGTLIRHVKNEDKVYLVVATTGEFGPASVLYPDKPREETKQIREKYLRALAAAQGLKEVRLLGFEDSQLADTIELRLAIAGQIRELKPDILITHFPEDAHPDLAALGNAVMDGSLHAALISWKMNYPAHEVKKAYTFAINSSRNFEPSHFIDITDLMDAKIEAARAMEDWVAEVTMVSCPNEPEKWAEWMIATNRFWGLESGVKYAEAFKEIKLPVGNRTLMSLPG
jgi:N-acetylglucosamine malate deacetylase 1